MSFQIERGLFRLDFTDHHAILGVPVDAEIKDIRKRYLKIARRLHPDSFVSESESEKQIASQLLSKLVNPAWEKLSQERDRVEYGVLLKLKGQQGLRQQATLELGNLAAQLAAAPNPEQFYATSLKSLAEKQYEHLDQTIELTAQLSELNLAYLMRREGKTEAGASPVARKPVATTAGRSAPPPVPPPPQRELPDEPYYRRAEANVTKGNFAQAILELRDGLQADPKSSRCHSLMGMIYLKQNKATMAKIHFNKALELNPQNTMALEGRQQLEQPQTATGKGASSPKAAKASPKGASGSNKDDKSGGGLFGLFGGKKK